MSKALHMNFRALTMTITVALILRNLFTCFRAFRMIIFVIISGNDSCSLLTLRATCSIESVITLTPLECACWSFMIVTLERIVATIFKNRYEKIKFYPVAIICGLIPWMIFGYDMVTNIISSTYANPELLPYCSSITSRNIDILQYINYRVPLAAGTALVSLCIYFINKRAKQFEASSGDAHLSIRYQTLENIEATKLITVHTICFLLFYIQNVCVLYLISQLDIKELPVFAIAKELSSLTFPIHGNVHVILSLIISKKFRQRFSSFRFIRKGKKITVSVAENPTRGLVRINNAEAEQEAYFSIFKKQWG